MADIRQPFPQPPSTGRELTVRPNFTIPGGAPYPRSGPPQAAPQPAAAAPQPTAATPQPGWFKRTAGAIGDAGSNAANKVRGALPAMPAAPQGLRDFGSAAAKMPGKDAALLAAAEAPKIYEVGSNPNATKTDVATQYAESGARVAGATAGAALGGKLGVMSGTAFGPGAAVASPVLGGLGALGGGIYGYYAADDAVEGARQLAGQDTRPVAQRLREDSPTAEQAAAARPGIRPFTPSDAGAGRASSGFKDPRVVADPATSLRKDFSGELAGVPQNLPSGLEDGRVYKTTDANGRTVYSGRNVRENAGVVDGQGGLRGYLGGGNPEPATDAQGRRLDGRSQEFVAQGSAQPGAQAAAAGQPPAAQPGAQAAAAGQPPAAQNVVQAGASPSSFGLGGSDAAISQARQAAAARGDWDAVSRSYGEAPQGGQGGPSLRMGGGGYSAGPSVAPHVAQSEKFAQQVARSNAESAAMAAIKSGSVRERGRGMATLAQLAGGDQDAATSRYNNDNNAATSRYGSDNSLRGSVYSADSQNASSRYTADMGLRSAYAKNMPAQAQRQAQSMAMQMAGGDIPTAMKILAQQGYSTEGLGATQGALNSDQTTQQGLSKGAREATVARFSNFIANDPETGKPVAGGDAALLNQIESIVPGYSQASEQAQAQAQPLIQASLNVLKGLNTTANNGLLQALGWDHKNPRLDQLPGLNGAKLGQVGKWSGALTDDVSAGDYELDLGGGRKLYLPRDQVGENELALLRARGVNVPK